MLHHRRIRMYHAMLQFRRFLPSVALLLPFFPPSSSTTVGHHTTPHHTKTASGRVPFRQSLSFACSRAPSSNLCSLPPCGCAAVAFCCPSDLGPPPLSSAIESQPAALGTVAAFPSECWPQDSNIRSEREAAAT